MKGRGKEEQGRLEREEIRGCKRIQICVVKNHVSNKVNTIEYLPKICHLLYYVVQSRKGNYDRVKSRIEGKEKLFVFFYRIGSKLRLSLVAD